MNPLQKLALAASYVTSIPFLPMPQSEAELSGLSKYLPAVGILIGAVLALVYFVCRSLNAGAPMASFLIVLAWLAITGCIHLDGLMDAADGLLSHRSSEKMLEIMKDSRVGNFGAIAGILLILAKFVALLSLPSQWIFPALLLLPVWSRWLEVLVIASYPYARPDGMGKIWHDTTSMSDLLIAAAIPGLFTLTLCFILHAQIYSLLVPMTVLPGILFSYRVQQILNGQTGDTYGASVEFSEAAGLILLSLLYKFI